MAYQGVQESSELGTLHGCNIGLSGTVLDSSACFRLELSDTTTWLRRSALLLMTACSASAISSNDVIGVVKWHY